MSEQMVFTLEENDAQTGSGWERRLQDLRRQQESSAVPHPKPQAEKLAVSARRARGRTARENEKLPEGNRQVQSPGFGDEELDAAYRVYLREREAQHNEKMAENVPVGIMIEEDWLAAQSALQSERNRRYQEVRHSFVCHPEKSEGSRMQPVSGSPADNLPPYTVHVYDLPDFPAARKIKIISEQEFVQAVHDKLQVHLSNAVSGMVRQAVQKKLATLSYDLQAVLNEETGKLVQDVLEHNLAAVVRNVKNSLLRK